MKLEAAICNDEIDEAKEQLKKCKDPEIKSKLKGWIRKQKLELKALGIKGTFRGKRKEHHAGDNAVVHVQVRPLPKPVVLASIDL